MKLYSEPVLVHVGADGTPERVIWRSKPYRVLGVEERWLYNGKWWTTPRLRGRCRKYYRLTLASVTKTKLEVEIYQDSGHWVLSRLLD